MTSAKRGDLAVFELTRRDYYIGQENPPDRREFHVGVVTSITREGVVKMARMNGSDHAIRVDLMRYDRLHLVSSDLIDVPAAITACHANQWPSGHEGMPFDSLDAIKAVIRTCKRTEA